MLAEARDNVQFGTPDEWAGLAEPDGVEVVAQELWSEALAEYSTDGKIELAKELERLTLGCRLRGSASTTPTTPMSPPSPRSPPPPASAAPAARTAAT